MKAMFVILTAMIVIGSLLVPGTVKAQKKDDFKFYASGSVGEAYNTDGINLSKMKPVLLGEVAAKFGKYFIVGLRMGGKIPLSPTLLDTSKVYHPPKDSTPGFFASNRRYHESATLGVTAGFLVEGKNLIAGGIIGIGAAALEQKDVLHVYSIFDATLEAGVTFSKGRFSVLGFVSETILISSPLKTGGNLTVGGKAIVKINN